ncbi:hypothetical protein [Actinomadura luteofluorescens]|uniref:hypothetical protein n=1 Tax=Actinomadura luteofluorescens TaxID=46163 RepID=UPI003D8E4A9A
MTEQMAIAAPTPKMTTRELRTALRRHYCGTTEIADRGPADSTEPELLVEEVAAPGTNRRCDLLRLGIWPSRGHNIVVHELKVSRGDWLRELDDPAKAEAWWPYCHEFWIVAPNGIVDVTELPDGWGLMVPPANARSRRFRVLRPAAVKKPNLTVELLVEIVRRADNARLTQIADLNRRRDDMIRKAVREARVEAGARALPPEVTERVELLEKLEKALGTPLTEFGWGTAGDLRALSVDEIAAAFREYTTDHAVLQRREKELERRNQRFGNAARRALEAATEINGGEPIEPGAW